VASCGSCGHRIIASPMPITRDGFVIRNPISSMSLSSPTATATETRRVPAYDASEAKPGAQQPIGVPRSSYMARPMGRTRAVRKASSHFTARTSAGLSGRRTFPARGAPEAVVAAIKELAAVGTGLRFP